MFVMGGQGMLRERSKRFSSAADNQALIVRHRYFAITLQCISECLVFSRLFRFRRCKITTAVAAEIVAGYDAALTLLYYKCSFEH